MIEYDPNQPPDPESWLEMDEQERLMLIEQHHESEGLNVDVPSPTAHAAMHAVVENQIAEGQPPETASTVQRLQREGLDRHDAIHSVASVLAGHIWEMQRHRRPFDQKKYLKQLRKLTAKKWLRGG